jgi:eukaryotic-like serine/threonine-protein kinase
VGHEPPPSDRRLGKPSPVPLPASIGPYRILGVLGRGGMGVVYRGEHVETGEPAAVKTVRAHVEAALSSIRREVHALGRLRHPGIVRIVDEGVSAGLPWYAMQLLEGSTLRDWIGDAWRYSGLEGASPTVELSRTQPALGPPPGGAPWATLEAAETERVRRRAAPSLAVLLSLARRLCSPLTFLHGSGLVHRDLKPENIFVREDGRPVLVDLGIATRFGGTRGREELEADDRVMGSVAYMAPEQIRGELVDARADLYALGCILYECVTGRPPFTGSQGTSILYQHLLDAPVPPAKRAHGVPEALDRLVLQLLEKRPQDRLGYADDVAAALAALGAEGPLESELPARAYLYRPEFTGRAEAMATLDAALGRLERSSRGGLVLVRGESGVGKTRLSMEMARAATQLDLTVITGQCAAGETGAAAPLHPLRPLLLTVADRCAETSFLEGQRILGPRGKVLAAYEPALLDVLDRGGLTEPPPVPPEVARARVIDSLKTTLFELAKLERVVIVLDDLQWADELSLSFLAALAASGLGERAILLVCTYRMEETRPEIDALAQSKDAVSLTLERLDAASVGGMVSGMLALRQPPATLLDFLMSRSSGNPFFVAEYLHAAIAEGMLARDAAGRWQFNERGVTADALAALPLPETLAELLDRRLGRLDADQRAMVAWAAVLGRELDGDLLASADDTGAMEAIEALRVWQILEETPGGRLRFVHDKIRELVYGRLDPAERRALHRRAGEAIEVRAALDPDAAATIAHHFAQADVPDKASRYFARAADRARAKYANREAIASYRSAIAAGRAARAAGTPAATLDALTALHERLGEVLALVGQRRDARDALCEALEELRGDPRVERARLLSKLARTWETEHLHGEALRVYDEAEAVLGASPEAAGEPETSWWTQWVELQVERVWVHYWLADVAGMTAHVERARPEVERRGTPAQRARFFQALAHGDLRRERYALSMDTVALMRASVAAAEETGDDGTLAYARFVLGFTLIFSGTLDEAGAPLRAALDGAVHTGDLALQARCLTYLTVLHRLRGDVDGTRAFALRAFAVALDLGMHDYLGVAYANLGWSAWRDGDRALAVRETESALAHWAKLAPKFAYPLQWMARLPGVALALDRGALEAAVAHAQVMLDPPQHRLPEAVLGPLGEATRAWERGDAERAATALREALAAAAQTERGCLV